MPDAANSAVILTRLDSIQSDVTDIKQGLEKLNGTVRVNCQDIAVLKATSLSVSAIKISSILGGVIVIVAALGKVAGLW